MSVGHTARLQLWPMPYVSTVCAVRQQHPVNTRWTLPIRTHLLQAPCVTIVIPFALVSILQIALALIRTPSPDQGLCQDVGRPPVRFTGSHSSLGPARSHALRREPCTAPSLHIRIHLLEQHPARHGALAPWNVLLVDLQYLVAMQPASRPPVPGCHAARPSSSSSSLFKMAYHEESTLRAFLMRESTG
jgi:hypothetical protein